MTYKVKLKKNADTSLCKYLNLYMAWCDMIKRGFKDNYMIETKWFNYIGFLNDVDYIFNLSFIDKVALYHKFPLKYTLKCLNEDEKIFNFNNCSV